ncbi:hypothetical protein MTR_2g062210 [Medicago truncatula]|uniref:Uncharacterized protein n=1 Tax=Medicago truncatula TaxID=3880 RepID=A2Q3D0_MEDTR|nr:hypothetical protein MtrDRAFT_AC155880g30v2 [Medicago truncatula]AES66073.1 hypothetical protein MTR_2g062210 [Medicago truncatula]
MSPRPLHPGLCLGPALTTTTPTTIVNEFDTFEDIEESDNESYNENGASGDDDGGNDEIDEDGCVDMMGINHIFGDFS